MARLNYHHLYYFWRVARNGNLSQTAAELHTSQSSVSSQIKQLEENMDVQLFERQGRRLTLTEAGQKTLLMANEIFSKGEELEAMLKRKALEGPQSLRIGAMATMSRNFIESFLGPLIRRTDVNLTLTSRGISTLLNDLVNHQLDLVLSNVNVAINSDSHWQVQLLARQPIAVVGPAASPLPQNFPRDYQKVRWVLPGQQSEIRAAFDAFCARHQFDADILAQVDDMAMLRLMARDSGALAVLPRVVVKDELASGVLREYMRLPNAYEHFYAVTIKRSLPPPILGPLLTPLQLE